MDSVAHRDAGTTVLRSKMKAAVGEMLCEEPSSKVSRLTPLVSTNNYCIL
jgi:hypothetical protein